MTLTGLFLVLFLLIHLLGNLQLFVEDGGKSFNIYTHFMGHHPLIQGVAKGLYLFIIIHSIQGILIAIKNRRSKQKKYASRKDESGSWASKNMALLGSLVLAFLFLHMGDFWWKLKFHDDIPIVNYDGETMKDAYLQVKSTFSKLPFVIAYLVGLLALSFHLYHGFESSFQTLGIRHKKYTPIIRWVGIAYSIVVPLAFALMPIYFYLKAG